MASPGNAGAASDDFRLVDRKLTDAETQGIRDIVAALLSERLDADDVSDIAAYCLAMLSNEKTIAYVIDELAVFFADSDPTLGPTLGAQLQQYLMREEEEAAAVKTDNALTRAGALGASRESRRRDPTTKKESPSFPKSTSGRGREQPLRAMRESRGGGGRGDRARGRPERGGGRGERGGRPERGGGRGEHRGGRLDHRGGRGNHQERGGREEDHSFRDRSGRGEHLEKGGEGEDRSFRGGRGRSDHRGGRGEDHSFRGGGRGEDRPFRGGGRGEDRPFRGGGREDRPFRGGGRGEDYSDRGGRGEDRPFRGGGRGEDHSYSGGRRDAVSGHRRSREDEEVAEESRTPRDGRFAGGRDGRAVEGRPSETKRPRPPETKEYHAEDHSGDYDQTYYNHHHHEEEQEDYHEGYEKHSYYPSYPPRGRGRGFYRGRWSPSSAHPSPIVAAAYRGGRGGRAQAVKSMIAAKTWVRTKPEAAPEGGEAPVEE